MRRGPKPWADEAARDIMALRGHVVIGYPPDIEGPPVGAELFTFAGKVLRDGSLTVLSSTDKGDWDAQLSALFGAEAKDCNDHSAGSHYYQCRYTEGR